MSLSRSLCLIILAFALPLVLLAGGIDDERAELNEEIAKLHTELAEWCIKVELVEAAAEHKSKALEAVPGFADAAELTVPDTGEPRDRAHKDLEKKQAKLTKELLKAWGKFAKWCSRKKRTAEAEEAWARILELDPTNRDANQALGRKPLQELDYEGLAASIRYDLSKVPESDKSTENFQRAERLFKEALAPGLKQIHARLGFCMQKGDDLVILFDPKANDGSSTLANAHSGEPPTRINVFYKGWNSKKGDDNLKTLICHELVHAVQILRMGSRTYQGQPKWFREGMAVFTAAQGPARVKWALRESGGAIDPCLDGLEPGKTKQQNPQDYAEAYLAVRLLQESIGEAKFQAFIQNVIRRGKRVEDEIEDSYGKSFEQFQNDAHDYARKNAEAISQE